MGKNYMAKEKEERIIMTISKDNKRKFSHCSN